VKRVLFLCIGNICRSPMAEAFARTYGSDVIEASSAGLSPALNTSALTRTILMEKNIDLGDHLPRRLRDFDLSTYDLVVNISGQRLPSNLGVPVENWDVSDPFGGEPEDYRAAMEKLEMLVMGLILRIRTGKFDGASERKRK
jgi:arsenate reductase (thioredoxin)